MREPEYRAGPPSRKSPEQQQRPRLEVAGEIHIGYHNSYALNSTHSWPSVTEAEPITLGNFGPGGVGTGVLIAPTGSREPSDATRFRTSGGILGGSWWRVRRAVGARSHPWRCKPFGRQRAAIRRDRAGSSGVSITNPPRGGHEPGLAPGRGETVGSRRRVRMRRCTPRSQPSAPRHSRSGRRNRDHPPVHPAQPAQITPSASRTSGPRKNRRCSHRSRRNHASDRAPAPR